MFLVVVFSTKDTISCRNKNSISLQAPSGMSTFENVESAVSQNLSSKIVLSVHINLSYDMWIFAHKSFGCCICYCSVYHITSFTQSY